MPRQADGPGGVRQGKIENAHTGETQFPCRSRNEAQADAGLHQQERREHLIGLVHERWFITGQVAGALDVIVKREGGGAGYQHQRLQKQARPAQWPFAGERRRYREAQFLAQHRLQTKVRGRLAHPDEAEVQFAAAERLDLISRTHVFHRNVDAGMLTPEGANYARKLREQNRQSRPDAEQAAFTGEHFASHLFGERRILQQNTRTLTEQAASGRGGDTAGVPFEQGAAQSTLQVLNAFGEGGLRDAERFSGAGEVLTGVYGYEST